MADFNIVIKVNPGPAVAGTKQVHNALGSLETRAKAVQRMLLQVFAVTAGGSALAGSIRMLANFSQEMSIVAAVSDASAKELEMLREEAKRLGITTRYTATQAAEGMTFLAKSGFTVNQVMESTEPTLRLAQAGALDLGRAADITSNILRAFGMDTKETAHLVDVLALSANRSNTDVSEIGQAMKFVAPSAAGMNVALETTVAAMESLSNAGLKSNMAGTGLRRVLGGLEAPTVAQTKLLNNMGISTEEVRITNVGLVAALERLKKANITSGESLRLFGQRGGPAADVMIRMTDQIAMFEKENFAADGTVNKFADTMDNNLNGALLRAKSAFQGLMINIGELGSEAALTKFLNDTASAVRWLASHLTQLEMALKLVGIAFAVNFYQQGIQLAIKGLKALRVAMVGHPILTWITIATLLATAFVVLSEKITMGVGSLTTLADVGQAAFELISDGLAMLFLPYNDGIEKADKKTNEFGGTVGLVFGAIFKTIAQVVDKTLGLIMGLIGAIVAGFMTLPKAIADIFIQLWNKIVETSQDGLNFLIDGLNKVPGVDIDLVDFKSLENEYAGGAYELGQTVKDVFLEGFDQTVVQDALGKVMDRADEIALARMKSAETPAGGVVKPLPPEVAPPRTAGSGGRGRQLPTFRELLAEIRQETALLKLSSAEYEIQGGLIDMQDKLKRKLTVTERILATAALTELQHQQRLHDTYQDIVGPMEQLKIRQDSLNELWVTGKISLRDYVGEMGKVQNAMLEINDPAAFRALELQKELLEEIKAPARDFSQIFMALNQLQRDGKITWQEYNDALTQARLNMLEATNTEGAGFAAGLLQIKAGIEDVSGAISGTLVNAFNGATDAIVDFVTTGKADFTGLIDSILGDLTRLLMNQMLFSLIPGMSVPGGLKFAEGGSFIVGGPSGVDKTPVSFMASRGERVSVETQGQQKASAEGNTNVNVPVKIVNVFDPSELISELNSAAGEKVILNTITKNRNTVKGVLAS